MVFSTIAEKDCIVFTKDAKEPIPENAGVILFTTYSMIGFGGNRSEEGLKVIEQLRKREWGLLLLDEVHVAPANSFRKVMSLTKSHCKIGLTATLVREDGKIGDLNFLIGPKLYEANWMDLTRQGFLANVKCVEIWCEMTPEYHKQYLEAKLNKERRRQLFYLMNPTKVQSCEGLIRYHEAQDDRILVFSDNTTALMEYGILFKRPYIYGGTSEAERERALRMLKQGATKTLFISKIGDVAIDIPECNVIIQISSHYGSRRQEAQRLGRVLRPKPGMQGLGSDSFSAFFYSLVSKNTDEMKYSTKRQQYLIDQGYTFKVIPRLLTPEFLKHPAIEAHMTVMSTLEEQRRVLERVRCRCGLLCL